MDLPALSGGAPEPGVADAPRARPSVQEIVASAAPARLDARGLAMQETAAKIKPLANFIYRAMQVGVLLIAAGTILGGVWADYSWGRFWGWDPKEVWALITLLVYLVPLHGRFAGWVSMFGLVFASVACFIGRHQSSFARYQSIVAASPASKSRYCGSQPSSDRSREESIAYRRSWPARSVT